MYFRISKNTNSIIEACLTPKVYIFSPINYFMPIILLSFPNTSSLILICYVVFLYLYFNFFLCMYMDGCLQ